MNMFPIIPNSLVIPFQNQLSCRLCDVCSLTLNWDFLILMLLFFSIVIIHVLLFESHQGIGVCEGHVMYDVYAVM